MHKPIVVYKGRTNVVALNLIDLDVSGETFVSEIRATPDRESTLIATWGVSFVNDGTDGKLLLTLDNSVTGPIEHSNGYMDVKRVSGGEPLPLFDEVLQVVFKETVTA